MSRCAAGCAVQHGGASGCVWPMVASWLAVEVGRRSCAGGCMVAGQVSHLSCRPTACHVHCWLCLFVWGCTGGAPARVRMGGTTCSWQWWPWVLVSMRKECCCQLEPLEFCSSSNSKDEFCAHQLQLPASCMHLPNCRLQGNAAAAAECGLATFWYSPAPGECCSVCSNR